MVGPSGSGKTTLLRLCNRLSVPTAGQVLFRGVPILELDPLDLRRRVGMVFQKPVLFGGTVADNLRAADPKVPKADLEEMLGRVGLPVEFLERVAEDISGGEAQRVCLARTLLTRPEVLLMDEPTASVDLAMRLGLEREAQSLADRGVPIVWVTHDHDQMRRLAGHVIALEGGRVRFQGTAEALDEWRPVERPAARGESSDAD